MIRRSFFNILILFCLLPSTLFGQKQSLNIREEFSNTELKKAFDRLETKYDLKIAYEHETLRDVKINCQLKANTVEEAFDQLLRNTGLEFQLVGTRRILVRSMLASSIPTETDPEIPQSVKMLISGKISDAFQSTPLPYANIYCDNGQGTTSDESGAFFLELDTAQFPLHLKVSYVGYVDRQVSVRKGEVMEVELVPQVQKLPGITVFEKKPVIAQITQTNATEISIQDMASLPTFVGGKDVFRDLQLMPGISAHDDLSANFSVRGGHQSENMIVFDGITLYNVDHYFGIFSAINPNIVDKVTVYKNAFPAEHGGRTSSVIDIQSNPLGLTKVNGEIEFNLLTSSAYLEIPIGKRIGLLISGRITNSDIARGSMFDLLEQDSRILSPENNRLQEAIRNQITTIEPNFYFNDVNAKLFWQIGAQSSATASFFNSHDDFAYSLNNNFNIPIKRGNIESNTGYLETSEWQNRGLSLQLKHQWLPRLSSHLTLGHSSYENFNDLNYSFSFTAPNKQDSVGVYNFTDNSIQGLDINLKNNWAIGKKHSLDFGYQFTQNDVHFQFTLNDRNILDGNQDGRQNALYLQYHSALLNDRLQMQIGLRQTFYDLSQKSYLSPRFSASYQLNDQWLIKGAWSKYYQFLRESTHESALGRTSNFWLMANDNRFPVSNSINRMLGLRFAHNLFDIDIEFYDRKQEGVMEHAQVFTGFAAGDGKPPRKNFRLFIGEGQTHGMDVLLKKTSGHYTGWLSYTLSKRTNSFPKIDRGTPFPTQNDRRHQLQLIQQYQWKKWNVSFTYIFASGHPYTDLSILSQDALDRRDLSPVDRINYLDDYHRVDIGTNFRFDLWKGQAELGASVFNLFDRQNVKYRQYIYSFKDNGTAQKPINTVLGTELQMLPFTPNLRFSWRF